MTISASTSREEFAFLADLILQHSHGAHTIVALQDQTSGTTRFANNQVVQNVNSRRVSLSISVAFGQQQATAVTTDLSVGSVRETLTRAETLATASPADPEYLPPLERQTYLDRPTHRLETAETGPDRRIAEVRQAVEQCRAADCSAAGIVSSSHSAVGLAADTGLFAYEPRTDARFSLTATRGENTGWASAAHRSIDHLQVSDRTALAIDKARRGASAIELSPGRYTVVLEPAAAAGLWTWLARMLDAKAYDKGTSPFTGRLGQKIVDERLTLINRPEHPDLLGTGFTADGLPSCGATWIERGILSQLMHDRFTAKQHGLAQIPTLEAPCLSGEGPVGNSVDALVQGVERGIVVTNFWYIRWVNPNDLTLTGMTRDGTFLIEDGRITSAVKNFRFHDSPLRAFNAVEAFSAPQEAANAETTKWLVPAMTLRDFHFSSATRF
jgi:predicted Zn-dependent protease